MAERRIGIIMHGITGRMGYNQHLVRSILAIRDQGGLPLSNGDVLKVDPILVGRNINKVAVIAKRHGVERFTDDPSISGIRGAYSAAINHYLREELDYRSDLPYETLTGRVQPWSYKEFEGAASVGILQIDGVTVRPSPDELQAMLNALADEFARKYKDQPLGEIPQQFSKVPMGRDRFRYLQKQAQAIAVVSQVLMMQHVVHGHGDLLAHLLEKLQVADAIRMRAQAGKAHGA